MQLLAAFLFAVSASFDSFAIALSYGIKNIRINFLSNFLIALISGAGTLLSMLLGLFIRRFVPVFLADLLGSLMLIGMGLWFLADALRKNAEPAKKNPAPPAGSISQKELKKYTGLLENPESADADRSGRIDCREAVSLALALTLNNLGMGAAASAGGVPVALTVALTTASSLVFVILGEFIGCRCASRFLGKAAPFVSGAIVLLLGIFELLF